MNNRGFRQTVLGYSNRRVAGSRQHTLSHLGVSDQRAADRNGPVWEIAVVVARQPFGKAAERMKGKGGNGERLVVCNQ